MCHIAIRLKFARSFVACFAIVISLASGCSTGAIEGALGPVGVSTSPASSTTDNSGTASGQPSGTTAAAPSPGEGTASNEPDDPNGLGTTTQGTYTVIGANFDPNDLKFAYYHSTAGGATTGTVNVSSCDFNIIISSDATACDSGQYVIQNANIPILSIAFSQNSNTSSMQPDNCSPPNYPASTPWPASFFFSGSASMVANGNTTAVPVAQYAGSGNVYVEVSQPLNSNNANVSYTGTLAQSPNQTPVYLSKNKQTRVQYNLVAKPCKFSSTMFQ